MKKKLLLLLVICLAAALLLVTGAAADGNDTITGSCGENATWSASEAYDGYRLTIKAAPYTGDVMITGFDFSGTGIDADDIVSVHFGASLDHNKYSVGDGAFEGFINLQAISSYGFGSIGENAFADCVKLQTLNLTYSESDWNNVEIKAGNDYLLACKPRPGCTINLLDSNNNAWVIKYDESGDSASATVTKGKKGNGVVDSYPGSLYDSNYTYAKVMSDVTELTIEGNIIDYNCISKNSMLTSLKRVNIEDGLTTIGERAFARCDDLTSITIPASVISIGTSAFNGCSSLESVTLNEGLKSIGLSAFSGTAIEEITIPTGVETVGRTAFSSCTSLGKVVFGNVGEIGYNAFKYCSQLASVIFNGDVGTIGSGAFAETPLTELTFNGDVGTIGGTDVLSDGAFADCKELKNVCFNGKIGQINVSTFSNCTALASVDFENGGPERIGFSAFDGCTSLTSIELGEGLQTIGSDAFRDSGLTSITIPDSVTSVGSNAFENCKKLVTADLGNITELPGSLFSNCSSLANVTLGDKLLAVRGDAFLNCTSLKSITIPDSVTSIGYSAFSGCTSLENVTLSRRISSIADYTFQNCTSLKTITIPDAVTSIGANAFNGCSALTSVTTGDFINTVGASAFDNCPNLTLRVYDGSYMQAYAAAYNIPFKIIPGTEDTVNSIESVTSAPGFDKDGKPCTVVTITMTNGDVEEFYIYDGEDGQDGEDGKDGEDGEDGQDGEIVIVPSFSDVSADSYYSDAVNWAVANGITTGTGNGEFSPDDGCSRAQVVTFLWRAMGCPEPTGSSSFNDVPADSYYGKAAQWALENGITTGVGGNSFGSNSTVTRAEVVTFLWRAAGSPEVSGSGFADVDSSAYYADAVAWAVANGITTGTGESTFSPDSSCTRAQIVTFLYRYFN